MSINRNIKEQFSTFFHVEEQQGNLKINNVLIQPELANNFDGIFQSFPDGTAEDFANFFVRKLQKNHHTKYDEEHLSAYLEKPCFWLARGELYQQLRPLKYTRLDCFQEARKVASQPINIYQKYNFKDRNTMTWGELQIKNKVKNTAYRGREFCNYATWSAPKYLSEKMLIEALKVKLGTKAKKEIESYVLARKSYNEIYCSSQPKKIQGRLPEPNQAQWEKIKEYYNFRCSEYNKKLSADGCDRLELITNFQAIKDKILTCIKAARDYICNVEGTVESIDKISDEIMAGNQYETTTFNHKEKEIETEKQQQMVSICLSEFAKLPLESQKIMQLHYGLDISQTEMKEIFGLQQYQISRKIQRSEQKLLKALVKWSDANLGITLDEGIIKEKNQVFKEWLSDYFKQQFEAALEENLLEQHKEKIMMLQLYYGGDYGGEFKLEVVAEKLNVSCQTVTKEIEMVKQKLEVFLLEWVREKMEIALPNSVNKRIVSCVEKLLNNAPYAMWNS